MGNIHHSIPTHIALRLRDQYNLRNFVETGTGAGRTAMWAAQHFSRVITIELDRDRCHKATRSIQRHRYDRNTTCIHGDSRDWLGHVLRLFLSPALIWLDGHWSQDLKYAVPKRGECPLLEEIDAINADGKEHVIMIDDAHQYVDPPNSDWPTFDVVKSRLESEGEREVYVEDDVIVTEPMRG